MRLWFGAICINIYDDDKAPEYFDDTAEKEDVEEYDEEGGDGEEEDAAAVVHPTVNRVINVPGRDDLDYNVLCTHAILVVLLLCEYILKLCEVRLCHKSEMSYMQTATQLLYIN